MRKVITLLAVVPWAWCVLVAALDRRHRLSLDDVEPLADGPLVSVIVPARDEERGVQAAIASLAAQEYGALEVIVVDDESTDATASEAGAAATDRVRIASGLPVPTGWVGKSWACHQGFELSRGEWLLFTDADIRHAPDTIGRALALVEARKVEGVTLLPLIETAGLVEQTIQPAAAVLIRSFVAPGPLVRSLRTPVAIAAGGFILVSRAAYEGVGGHEAMRHELVDDQMLAISLKKAGTPLALAGSGGRVRVRMYVGTRETLRGWRKNTSAGLGGSVAVAAVLAGSAVVSALAPTVALVRGPRLVGALGLALQVAARAASNEVCPTPRRTWPLFPAGALSLSVISLVSSTDRLRGGVVWRGRRYRPGTTSSGGQFESSC
ncbi:MAG: glycosyltransferase [Thermoleophilia bacterium]|nr:glycosyltransferase [Thermoleophilia bacterium]